jgi:hypothetical protein
MSTMNLPEFYTTDDNLPDSPEALQAQVRRIKSLLVQRDAKKLVDDIKAHPEIDRVVIEKLLDHVTATVFYKGFEHEPCTGDDLPQGFECAGEPLYAGDIEYSYDLQALSSTWDSATAEIHQDRPEWLIMHHYKSDYPKLQAELNNTALVDAVVDIPVAGPSSRPKF